MRAVLSRFYTGWTHETTGKLTPRQAQGYYDRIPKAERALNGEPTASGHDMNQGIDIDALYADAEQFDIPTPKRQ